MFWDIVEYPNVAVGTGGQEGAAGGVRHLLDVTTVDIGYCRQVRLYLGEDDSLSGKSFVSSSELNIFMVVPKETAKAPPVGLAASRTFSATAPFRTDHWPLRIPYCKQGKDLRFEQGGVLSLVIANLRVEDTPAAVSGYGNGSTAAGIEGGGQNPGGVTLTIIYKETEKDTLRSKTFLQSWKPSSPLKTGS